MPPFQNIHVYELLARLLDVRPAPNDGSTGLNALLPATHAVAAPRGRTNDEAPISQIGASLRFHCGSVVSYAISIGAGSQRPASRAKAGTMPESCREGIENVLHRQRSSDILDGVSDLVIPPVRISDA